MPFLRPYRGRVMLAGVALVLAAGLVLALGQGLRHLIDAGFASASPARLEPPPSGCSASSPASASPPAGATGWSPGSASGWRPTCGAGLRPLLASRPAWFETARTGDILSRLTADVALLQALIGSSVSQGLRNALMVGGAFAMLLVTSPKLAGLVAWWCRWWWCRW